MRPTHLLLALAALASAQATQAEERPLCAKQCDDLSEAEELSASVSKEGCYVRVCQLEARQLYLDARYEEAMISLRFVEAQLADSPAYLMDRGLALYALGSFEEALADFDRILGGFPGNVKAAAQRGHALVRLERLEEAFKQFELILKSPQSEGEFAGLATRSYLEGNIGIVRLMQGRVSDGKQRLIDALRIDKRNKLAQTYLSSVVPFIETGALKHGDVKLLVSAHETLALRRHRDSARAFRDLIGANPRYSPAYFQLADILRSYQGYAECAEVLRVGEQHLPESVNLKAERLRCTLLDVGPTSSAAQVSVKELKELADRHPDNERIKAVLAAVGYEN